MRYKQEFAASLVQQTTRARNPMSALAFCDRYCPDEVTWVAPRYVASKDGFAQERPTFEERLAICDMMTSKSARELKYTFYYFLAARGLASYAFMLKDEDLDTLGTFWRLNVRDNLDKLVEKHGIPPEEDKEKFLSLMDTADDLYTIYLDKSANSVDSRCVLLDWSRRVVKHARLVQEF